MLEDNSYARVAKATVQAFEAEVEQHPFCFAGLLGAVVVGRLGMKGVVVTGPARTGLEVEKRVKGGIRTGRTVVRVGGGTGTWLKTRNELLGRLDSEKEGVWICERGTCREGKEFV